MGDMKLLKIFLLIGGMVFSASALPPVESLSTVDDSEAVCTVGSRWRDECNWCNCGANGKAALCTLIGCDGLPEGLLVDEPECEGNSRWKKDCNWCNCVEGRAVCTLKACVSKPSSREEAECVQGSRWKKECNWCHCTETGIGVCTKIGCHPDYKPPRGEPQCEDGSRWRKDCNWCSCVRGRPICSSKRCRINALTSSKEKCLLIMDSGPCFGSFQRFYYNKEAGSCETFLFGGCAGNANRFQTAEECQEACGGVAPATGNSVQPQATGNPVQPPATGEECDRSLCPWQRWGHYKAKGCLPQYDGESCCPTSFLCSSNDGTPQGQQDNCTYKNKVYDLGATIDVDHDCSASCRCVTGSVPSGSAEIRCASIECPHLFRPVEPGCRLLYRLGECCPYNYECTDPQSPELELRTPTCFWNNKTYHEGDRMFFDEYPCQKCICTGNFADPLGPGCSKLDCGLDFRYTARYEQGCVPIYFEESCCPIDWLCPDDSRIVTKGLSQEIINEAEDRRPDQCHLGSLSFEVGKSLKLSNCKIDCRCITPPEFTCVQYRSCEAVTENLPKDCPVIKCGAECNPVIDAITGCLSCSCQNHSFTCSDPVCPPLCETTTNYQTGCPTCYCKCPPLDVSGRPPCPMDCAVRTIIDDDGCQICECDPNNPGHPFGSHSIVTRDNCPKDPPCPMDCGIHLVMDAATGCIRCECDPNQSGNPFQPTIPHGIGCPVYPDGLAPCPMDCAIRRIIDPKTGCQICECDPNNPGNPFGPTFPLPPQNNCIKGPDGRAPCPLDCAILRLVDETTGCEICKCNPNNPGNPFRPPLIAPPQNCPKGPDGRAPCPLDCAILRLVDENTGCEICKCDPNNPGNPFGPPLIAPPQNCPKGPDGRAPCPLDCAILQLVDENTGCEICKCDPNNPGNPFAPPLIVPPQNCPKGPDGRAPCPSDCAILRLVDETTGCEICKCDPNNPGNPFRPPLIVPPQNCPKGPDGRAPCPLDCAILRLTDEETGCEVCKCDPNNPGNPFGPPLRPLPQNNNCPKGPDGRAPCPLDCAILRLFDTRTGCEICKCDPNNPGNPFGPLTRPIHFPRYGVTTTK